MRLQLTMVSTEENVNRLSVKTVRDSARYVSECLRFKCSV